ncbi:hypothetical protein EQ845_13205 [Pseudomonas putida]|uniref:hypothetical protein n=1 Tax=Pseudomonas TaxID=286 RepID=UPI001179EB1B|nr:hypothetical protein [Pseudomonas putida]TRO35386.1 hypothetical protein EQ845_13205 [Pseudomonas putida]
MAQYDTERGCPKCGGHEGYQFDLVEKHIMGAGWGEPPVSLDSGIIVSRSMVKCGDCGHRFRLDTLRALGAIGGEVEEGEGE